MKNFYIILFIFIFFTGIYSLKAVDTNNSCSYQSEIDKCVAANKNGSPRSIEDFICAETQDKEEIAYQIILDKKFKEIDEESVKFLDSLQEGKDYYFGPDRKETYIDGINTIEQVFGPYGDLWIWYKDLCDVSKSNSIIQEYMSCTNNTTTIAESQKYFLNSTCETLLRYKLNTYKKIANNVLQTNKLQVMKDYRKKQFQKTRTMYDKLIDDMYLNLDDITKINNQWNYKTNQCY